MRYCCAGSWASDIFKSCSNAFLKSSHSKNCKLKRERWGRIVKSSVTCQAARYSRRHNYTTIIPTSLLSWVVLKSFTFKIYYEFPHPKHQLPLICLFTPFSPYYSAPSFPRLCSVAISFLFLEPSLPLRPLPCSQTNSLTADMFSSCVICRSFQLIFLLLICRNNIPRGLN